MHIDEYQLAANKFCSKGFFGEDFDLEEFISTLEDAAIACEKLDKYKRALFYDNREKYSLNEKGSFDLPAKSDQDIVHGIIGSITEAGEAAEALVKALDKHIAADAGATLELDHVNVMEEMGDQLWYVALTLRGAGYSMSAAARKNIEKLAVRHKDGVFKATDISERDLEGERAALIAA